MKLFMSAILLWLWLKVWNWRKFKTLTEGKLRNGVCVVSITRQVPIPSHCVATCYLFILSL